MRNRKRIITTVTTAVLCVAVLCIGIFHFQNRGMDAETVALIEKFESYSGKLTPSEQQEFFETAQMLEAKHQNHKLPKSDATRLGLHLEELYRINPELWGFIPDDHVHNTDFAKRAAGIDELAAKVKAMDYPAERKAAILASIEEFRRFATNPTLAQRDSALLLKLRKTDPELIGLDRLNTGHILKLYPNTVYLYKKRQTNPDGTVREIITGSSSTISNMEKSEEVENYLDRLGYYSEFRPEGTPMPTPPAGIRFIDLYLDDPPENSIEEVIVDHVDELPIDPISRKLYTVDDHEHENQPDSSISDAMTSDIPHSLPEETAAAKSDIERKKFAEQLAADEQLKRLLEMSDAEIEAELERLFPPKLPTEESLEKTRREPSLTGKKMPRISPERFEKARAILNRYGREEGLHRLKASDPEVARQMEQIHRNERQTSRHPHKNQQGPSGQHKPE